jgi:hypothetical protein
MRAAVVVLVCLAVSACAARPVASNPKQITLGAGALQRGSAFQMADEHCKKYGKSAVPAGMLSVNIITFRCE